MKPMPKHAKKKFIQMLIKFEAPIRCIEEERKAKEETK